jgi:hypothetical protein
MGKYISYIDIFRIFALTRLGTQPLQIFSGTYEYIRIYSFYWAGTDEALYILYIYIHDVLNKKNVNKM